MILHSIIIPTCNRARALQSTLESVARLEGLENVEVIVVDNGSTDQTKNICNQYQDELPNFTYGFDEMPGLLTGRHKGTLLSKGQLLSFIDDDVELNNKWSVKICEAFKKNVDIDFVTGPCLPKYEHESPAWLEYFWTFMDNGYKYCPWLSLIDEGSEEHKIDPTSVWGLNFSIRKETLLELGGFHPDNIPVTLQKFQGDGETGLTMKAKENGYKALYISGALLHHIVPKERMTLAYFRKRFFYQGICDSYTWLRRKHGLYDTGKNEAENMSANKKRGPIFKLYNAFAHRIRDRVENMSEKKRLLRQMNEEYEKGFAFHQHAFEEQEMVRQWVLKKDYWDYQLPHYDRQVLT